MSLDVQLFARAMAQRVSQASLLRNCRSVQKIAGARDRAGCRQLRLASTLQLECVSTYLIFTKVFTMTLYE